MRSLQAINYTYILYILSFPQPTSSLASPSGRRRRSPPCKSPPPGSRECSTRSGLHETPVDLPGPATRIDHGGLCHHRRRGVHRRRRAGGDRVLAGTVELAGAQRRADAGERGLPGGHQVRQGSGVRCAGAAGARHRRRHQNRVLPRLPPVLLHRGGPHPAQRLLHLHRRRPRYRATGRHAPPAAGLVRDIHVCGGRQRHALRRGSDGASAGSHGLCRLRACSRRGSSRRPLFPAHAPHQVAGQESAQVDWTGVT